jgi:hypothetical protein
MSGQPGDFTPEELRRELFGDGPASAALDNAVNRLNQQLGADIADVIRGTFDTFGFAYSSDEVSAEVARQCRLKSETPPPPGGTS